MPVLLDGPVGVAAALVARDLAGQARHWCLLPDHGNDPAGQARRRRARPDPGAGPAARRSARARTRWPRCRCCGPRSRWPPGCRCTRPCARRRALAAQDASTSRPTRPNAAVGLAGRPDAGPEPTRSRPTEAGRPSSAADAPTTGRPHRGPESGSAEPETAERTSPPAVPDGLRLALTTLHRPAGPRRPGRPRPPRRSAMSLAPLVGALLGLLVGGAVAGCCAPPARPALVAGAVDGRARPPC